MGRDGREREPIPDGIEIRSSARAPETRSDVGVTVDVTRSGRPRNRLVTIGDSLTHGFQSGAIFNTDLSWPAIVARELGWYEQFRHPHYAGFGGIPLNLELLVRRLEERFGDGLSIWELPLALFAIRQQLAETEQWWDHGPGSVLPPRGPINHNLAVYGWDLRDALSRTADTAHEGLRTPNGHGIVPLVRNADMISAGRVLDAARTPGGLPMTPFEAAEALSREGTFEDPDGDGIETLIVLLGANNALGTVIGLDVHWSGEGYDDLRQKARYNVWHPRHFAAEWAQVVERVKRIRARHVIFGTVPHVTIVPIARGVGEKVSPGSRYFPYYTRPWIAGDHFDPADDPHLTSDEARAIDSAIDMYNDTIVASVGAARAEGLDWRVLDLAGLLDRLASRRYLQDPDARPAWWTPYELPAELQALDPVPDSRFFTSGPQGRSAGGLMALDGIHPTTITYGLMAREFMRVMQEAGVAFMHGDGVTPREGTVEVDWPSLIAQDTLISQPPRSLGSDVELIGWIDERIDAIRRLWAGAA
jgi:lysophospholipase L1-like esterase